MTMMVSSKFHKCSSYIWRVDSQKGEKNKTSLCIFFKIHQTIFEFHTSFGNFKKKMKLSVGTFLTFDCPLAIYHVHFTCFCKLTFFCNSIETTSITQLVSNKSFSIRFLQEAQLNAKLHFDECLSINFTAFLSN
jgi:hypothetical protein